MSWPADGKPRYVVARTNGMLEMPNNRGGTSDSARNTKQQATFAILDRAFCYRTVARYRTEDVGGLMAKRVALVERVATARCDAFNAAGEAVAA